MLKTNKNWKIEVLVSPSNFPECKVGGPTDLAVFYLVTSFVESLKMTANMGSQESL